MSGSTRLKGVKLKLDFGTPATDYFADVISVEIPHADADTDALTFADVADGNTQKATMKIKAIQSTDTDSFWSYVWDHSGETVAFTYAPHGNTLPTADQPHFIGMVEIGNKPTIGVEAGKKNTATFEVEWDVDGDVVKDEGA